MSLQFFYPTPSRPQEGVKIAATDEEAKAEAAAPAIVDIDVQANEILRYSIFILLI